MARGRTLPRLPELRWWDVAFMAFILSLPITYIVNGYPSYNAIASLVSRLLIWGVPYWFGRMCFRSAESARTLLHATVLGSLIYAPLALWEIRMSPQLHTLLYGAFQHSFAQMIRGGGYRPIVFTRHGLELALWFGVTLIGVVAFRRLGRAAPKWIQASWWVAPAFIALVVMCKSLGATVLSMVAAISIAFRWSRHCLLLVIVAGSCYVAGRIALDDLVYQYVLPWLEFLSSERAESFQFRMDNERFLLSRAWEQPLTGWAPEGFGIINTDGMTREDALAAGTIVKDSLWIITFGTSGFLGLCTLYSVLLAGATRCYWDRGARGVVEVMALSAIVGIVLLDTVSNSNVNAVAILFAASSLSVGVDGLSTGSSNRAACKTWSGRVRPRV